MRAREPSTQGKPPIIPMQINLVTTCWRVFGITAAGSWAVVTFDSTPSGERVQFPILVPMTSPETIS
jgi:hypothetical protein